MEANATNPALAALRDNVSGAIERGEAEAIMEVRVATGGPPSGFDSAVAASRFMRERDCDFLTIENVQDYSGASPDDAIRALRAEMGDSWADYIDGQVTVVHMQQNPYARRLFAVVPGRRWTRVHEYLSNGQLTARWFVDEATGEAREAESARKPKAWPMAPDAQEFARGIVQLAR